MCVWLRIGSVVLVSILLVCSDGLICCVDSIE